MCSPSAIASTYPFVAACVACVGVPFIVIFPATVMSFGSPTVYAEPTLVTSTSLAVPVKLDTPPVALKLSDPAESSYVIVIFV